MPSAARQRSTSHKSVADPPAVRMPCIGVPTCNLHGTHCHLLEEIGNLTGETTPTVSPELISPLKSYDAEFKGHRPEERCQQWYGRDTGAKHHAFTRPPPRCNLEPTPRVEKRSRSQHTVSLLYRPRRRIVQPLSLPEDQRSEELAGSMQPTHLLLVDAIEDTHDSASLGPPFRTAKV